jgi:hypothetical protein
VIGRADRWIRRTTIGCVAMLALIEGTVSYLHMHLLVELHGQPGWVVALTLLSVVGMIVAAFCRARCWWREVRQASPRTSRVAEPTMTGRC